MLPKISAPEPETPGIPNDAWLTEALNPATTQIDSLPTLEIMERINAEDARVSVAVRAELPQIARAVDEIARRMRAGGRLIYLGAGTSGRLGILDAAECPPTFGISPDRIVARIAGGLAFTQAVEGAEDDADAGKQEIVELQVGPQDCVLGIAASGRTPYVIGGLEEARRRGAFRISLACNRASPMDTLADISIAPIVGPEVLAGSTRMKAGTAQKMVLNMISTGVMIRLGKTFGNLMVNVQPINAKLRVRARQIVALACHLAEEEAGEVLEQCNGEVKTAIVSVLANIAPDQARSRLSQAEGAVRQALEMG